MYQIVIRDYLCSDNYNSELIHLEREHLATYLHFVYTQGAHDRVRPDMFGGVPSTGSEASSTG